MITNSPEFQAWFAGSKVVDPNGQPLKLYRGIHGASYLDTGVDRMEPREKYAMFFSSSPHVAASYGNMQNDEFASSDTAGAIFPVYVKCLDLREVPTQMVGGYRRFDMFKFDTMASRLGPGQGIVVKGIVDMGPRANKKVDPQMLYSYESDTYAFGKGTSIKSAVGNSNFNPGDPRMTEEFVNNLSRGAHMKKTFYEILAEKDEEFTYHVKSVANIHHPELFERVRMTLMPYRIKEIKPDGYTPWTKDNKTFPDQPNTPTYSIKVITGLPVDTKRVLETMAMICHIHISHLNMAPEDDVASTLVGKPQTIDKGTAQPLVGTQRIGEFMQELKKERREREKKAITREVYESFFTTHRGLENIVKKPLRKGYYMIEMSYDIDNQTYLRAEGPFDHRPNGNLYRDSIQATNAAIITEDTTAGRYNVQAMVEKIVAPVGDQMFNVGVSDMNSGRRFTSMVRAANPEIAREMAVNQVAEANRLDPTGLTAMAPKPANQIGEAMEMPPSDPTAAPQAPAQGQQAPAQGQQQMTPEMVLRKLQHALTQYDVRLSRGKYHNPYALAKYLEVADQISQEYGKGTPLRQAITSRLNDRLLDVALRAVGEPKASTDEIRGMGQYLPR